jgi:hypothetical protein
MPSGQLSPLVPMAHFCANTGQLLLEVVQDNPRPFPAATRLGGTSVPLFNRGSPAGMSLVGYQNLYTGHSDSSITFGSRKAPPPAILPLTRSLTEGNRGSLSFGFDLPSSCVWAAGYFKPHKEGREERGFIGIREPAYCVGRKHQTLVVP